MPNIPYAEGVATDETGAIILTDTILYLLGTALIFKINEIISWVSDATASQVLLGSAQVEGALKALIQQDKVAHDHNTGRYTLIKEVSQLNHPNGNPFLSVGNTVTLITTHTGTVTRIIHEPFQVNDYLVFVTDLNQPVHYSLINSIQK